MSDLSAEWPSSSFGPVLSDVLELLKRAHRILTSGGFLLDGDPLNPLGDGKSWILKCEPTSEVPTGADSANSARRCLESEGVKVDEVYKIDQDDSTLEIVLSPLVRPTFEVASSEVEKLRTEQLRKAYGYSDTGPIPPNRDIADAHNVETPGIERVLGEAWESAKVSVSTGVQAEQPQNHFAAAQIHAGKSRTVTARIRTAENPIDQKKEAFIFAAIKDTKRGRDYCDFLGKNIDVPFAWVKDRCPRDYPSAYLSPKWRRRIVQEKNRYSRKLRALERNLPDKVDGIIARHVRPLAPSGVA